MAPLPPSETGLSWYSDLRVVTTKPEATVSSRCPAANSAAGSPRAAILSAHGQPASRPGRPSRSESDRSTSGVRGSIARARTARRSTAQNEKYEQRRPSWAGRSASTGVGRDVGKQHQHPDGADRPLDRRTSVGRCERLSRSHHGSEWRRSRTCITESAGIVNHTVNAETTVARDDSML
jgi:hypothetical protein